MPAAHTFWRTDVEAIPAVERRLALYALQLIEDAPDFKKTRLQERDVLGALWPLLRSSIKPRAIAACVTRPDEIDDLDAEPHIDWDDDDLPLSDRRLRERLRQGFESVPHTLIRRLTKAEADVTLSPTVALLVEQLALDATTQRVLEFFDLYTLSEPLRQLLRACGTAPGRVNLPRLAALLGLPAPTLRAALQRTAPLRALGLARYDADQSDLEDFLRPSELLRELLDSAPADGSQLLAQLIEPAPAAVWPLESFPHLAREAERLTETLGEAARTGAGGVNALLYGEPGTGKTELARAVAAAAGLTAYQVRSADEDQDGLVREGRLAAYLLAQRLLARRPDVVLIFDEVEDVFDSDNSLAALLRGGAVTGRQKGWMNRILEENPVPALWIANRTDGMDPAFLRRFLVPVPCVTPPRSVRRQMAERHLGETGLSPTLLDELAADPLLAPAQLGAARRLLELRPGAEPETTVREGMAALRTLLHGSPAPRRREPATEFDVAYLNLGGGLSPSAIARALHREGRGTLCFYGPPGTGKTAFAEVLAEALDRELVARQASDLLSPYVGETEHNLARLFREFDPSRSVLLLDEVDSFLSDRRQAQHSWERTQVNELLQQMERFSGIFIAATNLMSGIDGAALRRFDFKLSFQALTAAQRVALFAREVFGEATAPMAPEWVRHLEQLAGLTPGDFATVCRQQRLLGEAFTPEQFIKRLVVEWQLKGESLAAVA
ncbi:AAA family ATPase [Allochromatium humboldtianum]|uniref:AAA family ATPase n=1 Tax=Allochromatium humboldtianum TaxID=504901 RepID=A0A850RBE4_9GAMM|nr:AAA family ATPase [Allochromatium humboldtianum]NVZ08280.1 AAA family ATPase [Allochromatium humboldtianum]